MDPNENKYVLSLWKRYENNSVHTNTLSVFDVIENEVKLCIMVDTALVLEDELKSPV